MDREINYRVNIDDSNFQTKLTQMRASLDSAVTGFGGGGMSTFASLMAPGGPGFTNGISDFGSQVRPITYTPPAIAMQPHFGMIALSQTFGQSFFGGAGPAGSVAGTMMRPAMGAAAGGFVGGVFGGPAGALGGSLLGFGLGALNTNFNAGSVPERMTAQDYYQLSTRNFASMAGDAAASGAITAASTAASLAIGGATSALFSSSLAGIGASLVAMAPLGYLGGKVSDRLANNVALQSSLEAGSFRFITGGPDVDPLTGRGFSRSASSNVAKYIQDLEARDVRYGEREYGQILEGGMQLDLFSGTQDVSGFKSKFKGLVDSLKTVTSVLHTSLKEGMEVIRGMRDMGVTNPAEIGQMTMMSDLVGRLTGRTGMEAMSVGQASAELFRGTGVSMMSGFQTGQAGLMMVSSALKQGTITRETISQAGGMDALVQQMTGNSLAFAQSTLGRGMMMAATNGLDAPDFSRLMGGDLMSILGRAGPMSPAQILKFQANQEEYFQKLSPVQREMLPIMGLLSQAATVTSAVGGDVKTNLVGLAKLQGIPKHLVEASMGILSSDPEQMREDLVRQVRQQATMAQGEELRNRYGTKAITNAFTRGVVDPLKDAAAGVRESFGHATESVLSGITGDFITSRVGSITEDGISRGQKLIAERPYVVPNPVAGGGFVDATESAFDRAAGGLGMERMSQTKSAQAFLDHGTYEEVGGQRQVSYMGATAQIFENMDAARDFQKKNPGTFFVATGGVKDKGGKEVVLGISEDEQGKLLSNRRRLSGKEYDTALAADMGATLSDAAEMAFSGLAKEDRAGRKVGRQEIGEVLFGKDFKTGSATPEQSARINAVAQRKGISTAIAEQEVLDRESEKAIQAAQSDVMRTMGSATDSARDLLAGAGAKGISGLFSKDATDNDMLLIGKYARQERVKDEAGNLIGADEELIRTMGKDRAQSVMRTLDKMGDGQRQTLLKHVDDIAIQQAKAHRLGKVFEDEKTPGAGGAATVNITDISAETQRKMIDMLSQIEQMIKTISALQEKTMYAVKRGG